MALAVHTPGDPPPIDMTMAEIFFMQAKEAYGADDMKKFEVARTLMLINMGLSTTR